MENYVDHRGRPRVVITGMGALSPLGNSAPESWRNAATGISGVTRITQFDPTGYPCQIAGEVKEFDPSRYMDFKEARRMSRASQLAVAAAIEALEMAGFSDGVPDTERTGVVIGTGMGGFEKADENVTILRERGVHRVNPFALSASLPNMPSHHVSLLAGTRGPISTVVAACATGTQALGEAAEFIRRGAADVILAGGVEGLIHPAALAGFTAMRALATSFNDCPSRASRPFDLHREGFVLSEGAGVLVLERMDQAVERGAYIYGEILGHASSSDAFHVAAPDPDGEGALRAMRWALADAGLEGSGLDYINAHGSSTPVNDQVETLAIKRLLGERAYEIAVSSTKSVMGHAMGGTGALEAIFCTYALHEGLLPPTINYETPDPECDLDYVPNTARQAPIRTAMSNSFGLGGQNACLILGRYDNGPGSAPPERET
jgi:3-oxoacyl-[acyl-carrier-protein] synthase II